MSNSSSNDQKSLETRALQIIAERNNVENLIIVNLAEDVVPSTGTKIFKFQAANREEPNGSQYMVVLDETGAVVNQESLSEQFAMPELTVDVKIMEPIAAPTASITIDPTVNNLVLKEGDTFNEVITVTVPKKVGVSKVDVYFLADTTGSMESILAAVRSGANNILTALNGLGLDIAFGVGNYKDFPRDRNPYAFKHQLNLTKNIGSVTTAINAWSASEGSDGSEGQLFALDQIAEPPGGGIGWRSGSKRIIVWFGDAPGHDPICQAISSLSYDITEISATNKLVAEKISVLAISTVTGFANGLDDDPTSSAGDYSPFCSIGGTPGQATRIANATGGAYRSGIDATNIVNTIIDLVNKAITTINNLSLVPTGETASFVSSISPATGYGPLSSETEHVLEFKVVFTGVKPCTEKPQVFTGTIDAVADDVVVASKSVNITVPKCKRSYSVKFVCGIQQEDCKCGEAVVRPGVYATEINIHNYKDTEVQIDKYVLPVVFVGSPIGREPKFVERKAKDSIVLPPNTATMDDCQRIGELLFDATPPSPMPLTIGFLEIVSTEELNVSAVYTVSDLKSGFVSIDVQQVEGKLK